MTMGGEYDDVDVVTDQVKTAKNFEGRIEDWVKAQQAKGALEKCLVVHFARVKEEFKKASVDFNTVVGSVCSR